MASRLVRIDHIQKCVGVAVDQYFVHWLYVAGFFALHPQLIARRAPEPSFARLGRVFQRFPIGVCQHQNILRLPVLHYDWKQSIALSKINILERLSIQAYLITIKTEINLAFYKQFRKHPYAPYA